MSGTLPSTPGFAALNLSSNHPTQTTKAVNGRVLSRTQDGQFFSFTASYPPMSRQQSGAIMAFIVSQKGQAGSFTAVLPEYSTTAGALTGQAITTGANEAVGSTSIELVSGAISTLANALKAGDLVKFSNHAKVYMVMADVTIGSGIATMTIEPGLILATNSGATLDYIDVQMTCRLSNDVQEFTTSTNNLLRYELDVIEDL
tara:strand:- start:2 stop:607 length:606 start_codon:yes stop_codon:yes gene_type:complete